MTDDKITTTDGLGFANVEYDDSFVATVDQLESSVKVRVYDPSDDCEEPIEVFTFDAE